MTTQLLTTELANLIQESKRKHNDLRQAADRSLDELKQLGSLSEQAAAEQLSQRSSFVNPFIIACGTKNAKFTGIAIVCLQRLIIVHALPRSKLDQVLEALMQASSAGLDVQLKILQALPSLLQNYASDLKGDLLVTALNICFILQSSKNAIVNNTAAATLQQLVVSVFDKVVHEDKNGSQEPVAGEAPTAGGQVQLHAAALDAYRIFNDLCLLTENQRPEFLRFSGLPQTFGLELIESVITNHAAVFAAHPEQAQILRARVIPLVVSALKGKPSFATTVRLVRILYTMLRRHMGVLPSECGDALEILTNLLDQDAALWKRALCMEVFRGIFADHALVRRIYVLYDSKPGERDIFKTLVATFVRLSTEKPAVIGLGPQSTIPAADNANTPNAPSDQAMLEASAMTGIIGGGSLGSEGPNTGISVQWSSVRVPCIDQLDKTEPPSIPESYIYSLVLTCVSSLSDGLAKFILPLTVPGDGRNRRKALSKHEHGHGSPAPVQSTTNSPGSKGGAEGGDSLERSASSSFKRNPVPVNPLDLEDHPLREDVKVCASIVDECWPAILATCSTFLYASLDQEYYHGLVRAFQRFAHVAGLLHLSTPRDAFLTTLGKSAVPPNVLTACHSSGGSRPTTPSPQTETPTSTLFSNARGLLGVEGLTPTSSSAAADRQRQVSVDASATTTLNTRNLLCLRALLNLGIALGPTLGPAWGIVLETLQQADFVLFSTGKAPGRTPSLGRGPDATGENEGGSLMSNFNNEVRAVETAASRLVESSVDFPNASFVEVVEAVCGLLDQRSSDKSQAGSGTESPSAMTVDESRRLRPDKHRRVLSFSSQASGASTQEFLFALTKLGDIATININRLLTCDPDASGWNRLTEELVSTLGSATMAPPVRVKAAQILSRLMLKAASEAALIPRDGDGVSGDAQGLSQLRVLGALKEALHPLLAHARGVSVVDHATDVDVHRIILEGLKSIIEGCGESLVCGWDTAFDIIGSVFEAEQPAVKGKPKSATHAGILKTRSSKLVRSSFSSLQLICSDFLSSLPQSCFLTLVDTLYKFCSQDDDLNIALTTVTFFWVLSDFLSAKEKSLEITAELMGQGANGSGLERLAADGGQTGSDAALWMLLLLRLTMVTTDERLELRNSAIQTLLRIFDAYGDRLGAEAWSVCVESVIFKLLSSLEAELKAAEGGGEATETDRVEWHGTAVVVVNGISNLLADYLEVLTTHESFNRLWRELLGHLATLLDFQVLDINTAVFKALTHILSHAHHEKKTTFSETSIEGVWGLWSRRIPTTKHVVDASGKAEDGQKCLLSYVTAFDEVYRLLESGLTVDRVKRMLKLLSETVEASSGTQLPDVELATPLQVQVLAAVQTIRTDVEGVPSAVTNQVSEFVTLAFEPDRCSAYNSSPKRSFVAMSKASMTILKSLVLRHASEKCIYTSGALATALSALCKPIALKYGFPTVTKSTQPWRLATSSVLEVLEATLPRISSLDLPRPAVQAVWDIVVSVADSILGADTDRAPPGSDLADDEEFDMESFGKLRRLTIPQLGGDGVEDRARKAYTHSLLRSSIIHPLTDAEQGLVSELGDCDDTASAAIAGLESLYALRPGRTTSVKPTARTRAAYAAFQELFSLVSAGQGKSEPRGPEGEGSQALWLRIARTAGPLLMLRCGLTMRGYAADQPLRGRMPQPLSQRKELVWTLRKLVELKSEAEALPALEGVEGESRRHLLRLYPLTVKSLEVRGDEEVRQLLREALEVVGEELGIV